MIIEVVEEEGREGAPMIMEVVEEEGREEHRLSCGVCL
jgi:hypothetical protein